MSTLTIEHDGTRRVASLATRVLIGRKSMNHLVIDHRTVSRMHAWLDRRGEVWFVSDAASRTGTRVNGDPIEQKHALKDGDQITIGPATLTFRAGADLPEGIESFDFPAEPAITEKGVLFNCRCGAPLWAAEAFYGHAGQCQYCGRDLVVPYPPTARPGRPARKPAKPPMVDRDEAARRRQDVLQVRSQEQQDRGVKDEGGRLKDEGEVKKPDVEPGSASSAVSHQPSAFPSCGVCQSPITAFEAKAACPSCGLTFHAECWAENYGCSAYGCPQVNALAPPEAAVGADILTSREASSGNTSHEPDQQMGAGSAPPFPWEFLLLAGSVFGALLGAVTFGLPSLAVAGGAVAYLARHRRDSSTLPRRTGVVLASAVLALLGMFTGAVVSYVLYFRRVG